MASTCESGRSSVVSSTGTPVRILHRSSYGHKDVQRSFKHMFKILILGDSGVGKTSLLQRFSDGCYSSTSEATVVTDFKVVAVELDGCPVKLQIWDTAGEERFRSLFPAYYRQAQGALLVYDITGAPSFRSLDSWLVELDRHCGEDVCVQLVGHKCDEAGNRAVSRDRGARYAQDRGLGFREGSAKSGMNVDEIFLSLALAVYETLIIGRPSPDRLLGGWEAILSDREEGGPNRRANAQSPTRRNREDRNRHQQRLQPRPENAPANRARGNASPPPQPSFRLRANPSPQRSVRVGAEQDDQPSGSSCCSYF